MEIGFFGGCSSKKVPTFPQPQAGERTQLKPGDRENRRTERREGQCGGFYTLATWTEDNSGNQVNESGMVQLDICLMRMEQIPKQPSENRASHTDWSGVKQEASI